MLRSVIDTVSRSGEQLPVRTREQWLNLAEVLVAGAVAHMSPDATHVVLPGEPSKHGAQSDGMEGFTRSLLLHAFRLAGDSTTANPFHTDRYLEGLHNGLRFEREGRGWLPAVDKGHAVAEAAVVAIALSSAPRQLWDPLDRAAQARLAKWLRDAMVAEPFENNWRLFGPVCGNFLASVGESVPELPGIKARTLSLLDTWDLPDGWISDGDGTAFDYYSSFALHYYPLMMAALHGDEDFAQRRGQAQRFLDTFPALIASDGAPLYFGRSLTYRLAVCATVSAAAIADALPGEPGAARELTSLVAEYFVKHGMIEEDGSVGRGWFGTGSSPTQDYSGPAASYWLAKTFANLLLPAAHPYWSEEANLPQSPAVSVLAKGLLVTHDVGRQVVRLANHGSVSRTAVVLRNELEDPLYSRVEYSSVTAPASSDEARSGGFVIDCGGHLAAPGPITPTGQGEDWAASRFRLRMPHEGAGNNAAHQKRGKRSVDLVGFDVHLLSVVLDEWMVHVLRIPRGMPWRGPVRWGGNAVQSEEPGTDRRRVTRGRASTVLGGGLESTLVGLIGFTKAGRIGCHAPPFAPHAAFPVLESPSIGRRCEWFVVASLLAPRGGRAVPPTATTGDRDTIHITSGGRTVAVSMNESLSISGGR